MEKKTMKGMNLYGNMISLAKLVKGAESNVIKIKNKIASASLLPFFEIINNPQTSGTRKTMKNRS